VGKRFWRKGPTAPNFEHSDVLPHLTGKVLQKMEEYREQPFFIYFPLPAPHTPILPSPEFLGKSKTNEYGDFVLMCDDVVGQVTKQLKELGLYDDTIVVYASDNGCSPMADFAELKAAGHNPNYIFRGHKADIYEGGHRIPLLVRWPNGIKHTGRREQLVCLCDFMATMADYFGTMLPDSAAEDSVSNLSLWLGTSEREVRHDVVHQSVDGSLSIRKGRYKLEMCPGSGGWSYPMPGEETPDMPRFQLYDLQRDIREQVNVIADFPEVAKELRSILIQHIHNGRSTPGIPQKNNGVEIWDAVRWLNEAF
jgi:arylsulfatase A-like enzyme